MTSRPTGRLARALLVVSLVVGLSVMAPALPVAAVPRPPTPAGCLPPTEPAAATEGPYVVGERTVTFVDTSRPTAADPARGLLAHPDRTLVTTILYPAVGTASKVAARAKPPVVGAAPAAGAFPLVEFSHGVTATGPEYVPVIEAWVRAGYVVAAPTFPLTSGAGASIADVVNQPADVSFVLTSMTALGTNPTDPLFGHLAPGCTAIAGHSLGAITTLATVYDSCCAEPRARAAISLSGWALPLDGGNYTNAPPVPLLLVHGDADQTVPYSASQQAFAELHGFRWFLTLHGAGHVSIFVKPWNQILLDGVIAFLNYQLKGDRHLEMGFPQQAQHSGVASLQRAS